MLLETFFVPVGDLTPGTHEWLTHVIRHSLPHTNGAGGYTTSRFPDSGKSDGGGEPLPSLWNSVVKQGEVGVGVVRCHLPYTDLGVL